MYLSSLLVEDGIRHLFHINLTVCLPSSLLTLLRAFQFPRRLGTCVRGPAVHLVPRLLSHPFCSSKSYLGRETHLAAAILATPHCPPTMANSTAYWLLLSSPHLPPPRHPFPFTVITSTPPPFSTTPCTTLPFLILGLPSLHARYIAGFFLF